MKGYNIFRNDRVGKPGGGVLLAVKQHIKCSEILNKTVGKNEIIAIEIATQSLKNILISSIYVPPTAKIHCNIFNELYNLNNNCIIVRDLNATIFNMGSRITNARGRQIQEVINEGYMNCIDDDNTTFEKNDYEEKIDWILASQPLHSLISNVETHPTIGTLNGHKPLTFDITIGTEPKPASPRLSLKFKAANWSKVRNKLNEQLMLTKYAKHHVYGTDRRRHAAVILFDIKAAFDSVWHDGLIYKLNQLRLPQYIMNYLMSFLQNRIASIEIENNLSKPFILNSGTPQGSPLSPLLYIIYTADSMNGIPDHTEHGLFADDTALWTSSNTTTSLNIRLQQSIDAFESWCKSWKLKLQPTKTELLHFTVHPRRIFKNPINVKIEDTIIKPS
ncbi:unnamed protein product, partial [Rotaria sp. Silwood1]